MEPAEETGEDAATMPETGTVSDWVTCGCFSVVFTAGVVFSVWDSVMNGGWFWLTGGLSCLLIASITSTLGWEHWQQWREKSASERALKRVQKRDKRVQKLEAAAERRALRKKTALPKAWLREG